MNPLIFALTAVSWMMEIACTHMDDFSGSMILLFQGIAQDSSTDIFEANHRTKQELYIYWYHPQFQEGDFLRIYLRNWSRYRHEEFHYMLDSSKGTHRTLINLSRDENSDKYCAEIIRRGKIVVKNISCEPKINWMYDRRNLLSSFTLVDLVNLGTHQSGSYKLNDDGEFYLKRLTYSWSICQDRSIITQLIEGIRYLDLRPGIKRYGDNIEYVVSHRGIWMMLMDTAIREINEFMDQTNDIVIVSFREFPEGFDSINDHQNFIQYLQYSFKKHALRREDWTVRLHDLWKYRNPESKRYGKLILSYDHDRYTRSILLWPGIHQYWGNRQTINALHQYFDSLYTESNTYSENFTLLVPHATMVELTHNVESVFYDVERKLFRSITNVGLPKANLRTWGLLVGQHIPKWFTEEWSYAASIIAVDFYQSSGVVDLAIKLNEERAKTIEPYITL